MNSLLAPGQTVAHSTFGQGRLLFIEDDMGHVNFLDGLKTVLLSELVPIWDIAAKITAQKSDSTLEVLSRAQAETIRGVNARWGVFARSKIDLLPHQLWVCHRVSSSWPTRWLVADDVGLGKTIEAGLILMALLGRGMVKRILVLCPASLVAQWQERLRTMFNIRLMPYLSEADTQGGTFWEDTDAIVASLDTIKLDRNERKNRMLQAPPFDLLLVDEAHRLGSDARSSTQAYRMVKALMDARRVHSAVFFTGTPHRGHDWGFYALLQLLDNQFDPKQPAKNQIPRLRNVLIRNNKAHATDMDGRPLFQSPIVESITYTYTPAEARFYERLTEFITSGHLYAARLDKKSGGAVMLVLISMQKLASSSVAAIAGAIRTRLKTVTSESDEVRALQREWQMAQENGDDDSSAELEEKLAAVGGQLALGEEEESALRSLLSDAETVRSETKIERILDWLDGRFSGRNILFFTEYKATQRLLFEALIKKYGECSASFINGDNALADVTMPDGRVVLLMSNRAEVSEMFNRGEVRFLISTEAGGEGIDLQGSCYSLIHVDLPWNPMRLHQRVGRLNRYGQTERVEVVSLRNPDTVESLVWEHLNAKLGRIAGNLNAAMDAPEDLSQLVLGLSSGIDWNKLHVDALTIGHEKISDWFDAQTGTLGGQDSLTSIQALVGEAARFDFGHDSSKLPRVDLPDLQPFLDSALALSGKRLLERRFNTPEAWHKNPRWGTFLPDSYDEISFDRRDKMLDKAGKRLIGAGHNALEAALDEALERTTSLALLPPDVAGHHLALFRVTERLSTETVSSLGTRGVVFAVYGHDFEILEDWQALLRLNTWSGKRAVRAAGNEPQNPAFPADLGTWYHTAMEHAQQALPVLGIELRKPAIDCVLLIAQT